MLLIAIETPKTLIHPSITHFSPAFLSSSLSVLVKACLCCSLKRVVHKVEGNPQFLGHFSHGIAFISKNNNRLLASMSVDFSKNAKERPEPHNAEVIGSIPDWLQGTLVRNGPGIFSVGETSYDHWCDGMSFMNSFSIKNGKVTHRSRFLRSDTYNSNMTSNRIVVSEMGTMAYPDPSKNFIFKAITFLNHTVPDFTDNAASNIIKYGNDYYATSETNYIRKIDPFTLETLDKVDYMKFLPVNLVSSHPHYDREGSVYNVGTSIAEKAKTKYIFFKIPAVTEKDISFQSNGYTKPNYRRFVLPVRSDKGIAVGENMVTLKYTTATAVKQKEGRLECKAEVLCEGFELPRINYDFNGKKHQFIYGNIVEESVLSTQVTSSFRLSEENCWPSEPVFVPRPNGESEDDGVLLIAVINCIPGQSGFLLILDGKTFKEVARAYVNTELHRDMHGFFIPHAK
uniref:Beta-carotene oxygenase 1 n=1 Tax=Oryzias melastigma TaxID=30732 RepID=A0A3B3DMY4_ORYME